MWKGILILGVLLAFLLDTQAQNKKEYNRVMNKKMSIEDILNHQEEFLADLKTYFYYKHDSVDFKIFTGPQMYAYYLSMVVMGIENGHQKQDKKEYVFRMIDSVYQEVKKRPDYSGIREAVIASETLQAKIVDVNNWEEDKRLLELIGTTDAQLNDIHELVKVNSGLGLGYMEMLQAYFAEKKEKVKAQEAKKREDYDRYWRLSPECTAYIDDIDTVVMMAEKTGKPILFFCSSYGKIEATLMHHAITKAPEVIKYISDHYIFALLYMDSKTMIPKEKRYFSDILGVEVKHNGHVNMEFLKKYFDTQEYPLVMIVTPELKEVARMEVTEDMKKFELFLRQEK